MARSSTYSVIALAILGAMASGSTRAQSFSQTVRNDNIRSSIESQTLGEPSPVQYPPAVVLAKRLFKPPASHPTLGNPVKPVVPLPPMRVFPSQDMTFGDSLNLIAHTIGYKASFLSGVNKSIHVHFPAASVATDTLLNDLGRQAGATVYVFPDSKMLLIESSGLAPQPYHAKAVHNESEKHERARVRSMSVSAEQRKEEKRREDHRGHGARNAGPAHQQMAPAPKSVWVLYPTQSMSKNIHRWCKDTQKYTVEWRAQNWMPAVRSHFTGTFKQAISGLVAAAYLQGRTLHADFYSNHLLIIRGGKPAS